MFPVLLAMFPTNFLSARLVIAVVISKSLTFTPVVVSEVVTVGDDAAEAENVVGAEEVGITGGMASQHILKSMPALT